MPSAALIRKKVVVALREQILPTLESENPLRMDVAGLPVKAPPGIAITELSQLSLCKAAPRGAYVLLQVAFFVTANPGRKVHRQPLVAHCR